MKTVKQLAEETFGKTKDGKGLVTLDDAIKFAEMAVEYYSPEWLETCNTPPDNEAIIILHANGIIEQGFYNNEDGYFFDRNWGDVLDPTHWMSLPELPEIDK